MTTARRLAPFRPSTAEQWCNCDGAARVNYVGSFIPDAPNPDADEGTTAHEYLEALLTAPSEGATEVSGQMKKFVRATFPGVPDESVELLETIADDVYWLKGIGGFDLHVERMLPITVAGSTHDCKIDVLLINKTNALIIDLKWGKGKRVEVERNKQLLMYCHAVSAAHPGLTYTLGVYQPRGVGTGLRTWTVPPQALVDSMVEFNAAGERSKADFVEYTPGDHCTFCDGREKGLCPLWFSKMIDAATIMIDFVPQPPWWILTFEKHVRLVLDKLSKLATSHLTTGKTVPGWKLITSKGNRRWIDPSKAAEQLAEILGGKKEQYENKKDPTPIGVTDATRLAKKAKCEKQVAALMEKPDKFVRVPEETPGDLGVKPIE